MQLRKCKSKRFVFFFIPIVFPVFYVSSLKNPECPSFQFALYTAVSYRSAAQQNHLRLQTSDLTPRTSPGDLGTRIISRYFRTYSVEFEDPFFFFFLITALLLRVHNKINICIYLVYISRYWVYCTWRPKRRREKVFSVKRYRDCRGKRNM